MSRELISPDELFARLDDVRLCDIRWSLTDASYGRSAFESGHIPGAVFVDLDTDLSGVEGDGRHPLPKLEDFASTLGRLGIGHDDGVVAYDDSSGSIAARLWWMLRSIGHRDVAVLDGGLSAWTARDLPIETGGDIAEPTVYRPRSSFTGVVRHDALPGRTVIDVRAPNRYSGEYEPVDPKAGHIPGAINIPIDENLDASGRFADPGTLRDRYRDHADDAVLSCGSGVNACHTALAMAHAGLPLPEVYIGSFSDWSSRGLEVHTGEDP